MNNNNYNMPNFPKSASTAQADMLFGQDNSRIVEKLIADPKIEKVMERLPFIAALSRSLKLTFLEGKDMLYMEHLFEAQVCSYLRSLPMNEYSSDLHQMIQQLRLLFFTNARRAVGTDSQKMNERIALLSQITYSSNSFSDNKGGHNLLRGLARTFGRGK